MFATIGVIASISILLLASILAPVSQPRAGSGAQSTGSGAPGGNSTLYPYLLPPSSYPTPSVVPTITGNVTFSKVASSVVNNQSRYALTYVTRSANGTQSVNFRSGSYNTTLAGQLASHAPCRANCSWNLPIQWSNPYTVAALGSATVQGLSISAVNSTVSIAASTSAGTHVYYSTSLGAANTWVEPTVPQSSGGVGTIAGSSPNITVSPCSGILLTTLTSHNLTVTSLPLACTVLEGGAGSPPPPPPGSCAHCPWVEAVTDIDASNGAITSSNPSFVGNGGPGQLHALGPPATGNPRSADTREAVWVQGLNLTNSTVVKFGTTTATLDPSNGADCAVYGSFRGDDSKDLCVEVPNPSYDRGTGGPYNGPSIVDVTASIGQSPTSASSHDEFDFLNYPSETISAPPTLHPGPYVGFAGMTLTLTGTNFSYAAPPLVTFNSVPVASVTVVSTTALNVTVPAGGGSELIAVQDGWGVSASVQFTYCTNQCALPTLSNPGGTLTGYPESTFWLLGSGFAPSATVAFGNLSSPSVQWISSSALVVTIPWDRWGASCPSVVVTDPGVGSSNPDPFCFPNPIVASITPQLVTSVLPLPYGGVPVWTSAMPGFSPTLGVVASDRLTQTILFYRSVYHPGSAIVAGYSVPIIPLSWQVSEVAPFTVTSGSAVFSSLGGTRLETPGGAAGQVAATSLGPEIFALFTTRSQNRTEVVTAASDDYGVAWGRSYLSAAAAGSVTQPFVAPSPAGYVYATWTDNGAGPWEVDQQVFAPDGFPLGNASVVAGHATGAGAQNPGVAVDGLQRPLFVWDAPSPTGAMQALATGAFLSPATATENLWSVLNATPAADYRHGTTAAQISTYVGHLNTNLTQLLGEVGTYQVCAAEQTVLAQVYTYVTNAVVQPSQNTSRTCGSVTVHRSLISNETGAMTANFSLSVETQWVIESLGFGVFPVPSWVGLVPAGSTSAGVPFSTPDVVSDPVKDFLNVNAWGVNPKEVDLNMYWGNPTVWGGQFASYGPFMSYSDQTLHYPYQGGTVIIANNDAPISYTLKVSLNGGPPRSYVTSSNSLNVALTNLTPQTVGTWAVNLTATYQDEAWEVGNQYKCYYYSDIGSTIVWTTLNSTCIGYAQYSNWHITYSGFPPKPAKAHFTIPSIYPQIVQLQASGNYSTYFGYSPAMPAVTVTDVNGQNYKAYGWWQESMPGLTNSSLLVMNGSSAGQHVYAGRSAGTPGYSFFDGWTFGGLHPGVGYTMFANATSQPGSTNLSMGALEDNSGQNSSSSTPTESALASCVFTPISNPVQISWTTGSNVVLQNNSAVLSWYSNKAGIGEVRYEPAGGVWSMATAQEYLDTNPGDPNYNEPTYQAVLNGLEPWQNYTAIIGVTFSIGGGDTSCVGLTQTFSREATWHFQSLAKFLLTEEELPYDSISGQGGGVVLSWQLPSWFVNDSQTKFQNGQFVFWPVGDRSQPARINLTALPSPGSCRNCFSLTVPALTLNTNYTVAASLNFTLYGAGVDGTNYPLTFWYAKDTSGDGLTDSEKVRGWGVATQDAYGTWSDRWVSANPQLYATNGLVSDYREKQFRLDPSTVDTAQSHMLDLWNLTFSLPNSNCPTSFRCWSESTWNPFAFAPTPGGSPPPGNSPVRTNSTGVAHWGPGGLQDDSPYDAEVLWTGGSLGVLQGLVTSEKVGWLRGVVMDGSGGWTLTVEGKLSFGANPLANSTTSDGIPDGFQLNPLGGTDVQVNITGWTSTSNAANDGVAAFIQATSASAPYAGARTDYAGYSSAVTAGCKGTCGSTDNYPNATSSTSYVVTFPVTATEQQASLNLSLAENFSTNSHPKFYQYRTSTYTIDLLSGALVGQTYHGSNWSLTFSYQALTVYTKSPTWILVPGDNSTLSQLPLGLTRYTAEENFILLEVDLNQSLAGASSESQGQIPYPNATATNGISGQYSIQLTTGISNFLLPRSLFVHSPLGQALLTNNSHDAIASTTFNSALQPSWSGSAWWNRVLNDSGTSQYVRAYSSQNQNCTAPTPCGGVASNAAVEGSVPSLAVGGIFVLNVTSAADLDSLLAGLLLNQSGNYTNWLLSATAFLPSLGLSSSVLAALANASLRNDGAYGAPWSSAQPPPQPQPWWAVVASVIWNAVSGVVTALAHLVSIVWNAVVAATSFIVDLASRAAAWGLSAANAVLAKVAAAIVWAIDQLAAVLVSAVKALFLPITSAMTSAAGAYGASLWSAFRPAWADMNSSSHTVSASDANALVEGMFAGPMLIALGIAVVVAIALAILSAVSIGSSFLASLIIGLVIGATVAAAAMVLLSLVPASAISGAAVSLAWGMYNVSQGGGFRPLGARATPDSGPACTPIGIMQSTFTIYDLVDAAKGGTKAKTVELAKAMKKTATVSEMLGVYPVVSTALGILGLILGIGSMLIGGEVGKVLDVIGVIVSLLGLAFGIWALATYGKVLQEADQYNEVLVDQVISGVSTTVDISALAASC